MCLFEILLGYKHCIKLHKMEYIKCDRILLKLFPQDIVNIIEEMVFTKLTITEIQEPSRSTDIFNWRESEVKNPWSNDNPIFGFREEHFSYPH